MFCSCCIEYIQGKTFSTILQQMQSRYTNCRDQYKHPFNTVNVTCSYVLVILLKPYIGWELSMTLLPCIWFLPRALPRYYANFELCKSTPMFKHCYSNLHIHLVRLHDQHITISKVFSFWKSLSLHVYLTVCNKAKILFCGRAYTCKVEFERKY